MLAEKRKTPLQFWMSDGNAWPELRKITVKLFSLATSTAASEKNFSTFGFIHSKLRNSLSRESVEKLVFIKSNYPLFTNSLWKEVPAQDVLNDEHNEDDCI